MEFTRKMVPVKFYSGLTAQQFANLEKSDDIFYQVDNDGLYKGSKKIASVGNNADLEAYITQQINNVRNQFNAVQNSDGTITLTVKGVNYTLVAANGGSVTPTPSYEMVGSPDNELASWIMSQKDKDVGESIYDHVRNNADKDNTEKKEVGLYIYSTFNGSPFYAYLCNTVEQAQNEYNSRNVYCKIRISNFVYFQPSPYSGTVSNDGEVVTIDQPYTENHYTDPDGGTVYEITQGKPQQAPTGIEFAGYNITLPDDQAYNVAVDSPINAQFTGGEPAQNESVSLRVTNSDKGYTIDGSTITFTSIGNYTVEAYNATYNLSETISFTVVSKLSIAYNMNGPMEFIPGQTWEQWIENIPRTPTNMNYGNFNRNWSASNGKVFMTTTKPSEVSQQDFDAVYPMKLHNVASTDTIVPDTFYYLELATDNYLVADNTALGEGEFNFTINGKSFRATEEMTLSQWVSSAYNTAGFEVKSVYSNPYKGFMDETAITTPYVLIKCTNNAVFSSSGKALMALGTPDTVITSSSAFTLYLIGMSNMYDPYFHISGYTSIIEVGQTSNVNVQLQNYNGQSSVAYTATSSDSTVISTNVSGGNQITYTGLKGGTATLTISCSATDNVETVQITVIAATPTPVEPTLGPDEEGYWSISNLIENKQSMDDKFKGIVDKSYGDNSYYIVDEKDPGQGIRVNFKGGQTIPEGVLVYFNGTYDKETMQVNDAWLLDN